MNFGICIAVLVLTCSLSSLFAQYKSLNNSNGYRSQETSREHPAIIEDENCSAHIDFTCDNKSVCVGEQVLFTNLSAGSVDSDSFLWEFGEGAVPHTAKGFGPHLVKYTESGMKTISLQKNEAPPLQKKELVEVKKCSTHIDFTHDNENVCIGEEVLFTNLSTGLTDSDYLLWEFGEGASPSTLSGKGPHHVIYSTPGSKDITLTVLGDTFLNKSDYVYISECCSLDFDVDKYKGCLGDTFTFSSSSYDDKQFDTLIWEFGAGASPQKFVGNGPVKVVYNTPGKKDFSLSVNHGLVPGIRTKELLIIEELPVTPEITTVNYPKQNGVQFEVVCQDSERTYMAEGGPGSRYRWEVPTLNISRTSDNCSLNVTWETSAGEYLVFVQEISEFGCYGNISDVVVMVNECEEKKGIEDKNTYTFTPNNDGYNDTWVIDSIEHFPEASIYVFDRKGNKVFSCDREYENTWDGTYKGSQLNLDSYYFVIDMSFYGKDTVKGILTLIH